MTDYIKKSVTGVALGIANEVLGGKAIINISVLIFFKNWVFCPILPHE